MIVKFDSLNRMEKPVLTLCNPGSVCGGSVLTNVVGILADHYDEEVIFNFNASSEFNFRIYLPDSKDSHLRTMYESVVERRLIFVENIGYFMITDIDDSTDKNGVYKDVKARSIDMELELKTLPSIEDGVYRFSTSNNDKGILERIVEVLPLWQIGHVDRRVAERWRRFEDVSDTENCLAFLLKEVQDAYECIIVMDIVNRLIDVYDQANYVRLTSIHLTYDDFINSLKIRSNDGDLYTAMYVAGEGIGRISSVNPTGENVIYNFDHYIDWMSEGLREKVQKWKEDIETATDQYYQANLMLSQYEAELANIDAEIGLLQQQAEIYNNCLANVTQTERDQTMRDSIIAGYNAALRSIGGVEIDISLDTRDLKTALRGLIATCDLRMDSKATYRTSIQNLYDSMKGIIDQSASHLAINKYFNRREFTELQNYIFEGQYTDEYIAITDTMSYSEQYDQVRSMYNRAVSQLKRVSTPTQEFDIDVENIVFDRRFSDWTEQLETGCLINAELKPDDIAELFLSSITLNFEDHKLTMKFGNRYNRFDTKSLFDNVLGKINKSANTINFLKDLVYPIKRGELNAMQEAIRSSRNLTMQSALSSENESVVIDATGYTGRTVLPDGTYDPRQVKIIGKNIVFTDDGWNTSKVAIGEIVLSDGTTTYGVNAETLIGETILGANLQIVDSQGNDLLSVVDGQIRSAVSDYDQTNELRLSTIEQNANEVKIFIETLSEDPGGATHLNTGTGYTFDKDGLSIHRDQEEMSSLIDNRGMRVLQRIKGETGQDEDVEILTATNSGVNAINLQSRQYLIIGKHARFEDYVYDGEERTACFYIETPME